MSTSLRVAALAVTISLSTGCGFFSLDDDDSDKGGSGSHPEMGGSGGGGGSVTMGGTGGSAQGGSAGSAMAGTSSGSGGDGAAGTGGSGGSDGGSSGAAAAGMAGSAGNALGGTAGDATSGGMGGMSGSGTSGTAGSGPVTCETLAPGSKSHAGHCYLLVTNGASWGDAKTSCSDKGGHLVTISSEDPLMQSDFDAENDFVFKELGGSKDTWIGLGDGHTDKESATDGEFKWVNDEALTLKNWNDNEPNHYMKACMDGSDCWEHCVFMMTDPAGKWNDELCEMSKQFVCEWDMGG
ncbi:MAG TPA: lectin-like protein [Polyangiaceae bacterium]|nr:lectin-like protein [Polyangiaceae bacterium]